MLNNDKNYAIITIAKTSSGLKSFKAIKNERGTPFSSATRESLKGEKGMKKLWQMLLVFAMAVSCVCAVACSNKNENKTCKHDYEETVVAATCTTGGYTEHKCSKCGDTYKDNEVAALNHDMTDWAEKTPATCTAAQVLEKHCKRTGCDYEETKDGDAALSHDMEWTITLNPTCTEDGKKDGACKRTGCTYTETDVKIDKLGHHYVESKTDPKAKAATCTEDGLKVEICDNPGCDDETRKESVIPALGHTDDGTKAVVTDPTCTEQGYTTYHCETCDQDYRDDYVNELGHEMALEQTVKVSCLTDGYELWICQRDNCECSEKREIADKLDHVFDTDGNCKSGCGKTINDKLTWINTKYDVTYNESADRLTLIGGDPGKEQIQQFVTIPAFLFKTMKEAGKTQFAVNLYKWSETTPIFGLNLTEESADWKYTNNIDTSSDVMTITDEMVEKGFKFILLYADLTQRDPAWKAKVKTTGLDFDIEFIKPFDINDKSMWVRSEFASTAYSTEKGKWTITDAAPGVKDVQKKVTVSADVFKAMSETYGSFKFRFTTKDAGTAPIFGFKEVTEDWTKYKYGNNAYTSAEKAITADMLTNGYSFTLLYADANKRAGVEAADVTGFDMDIEFMPKYDLNNKATWIMNGFNSCEYSVDTGKWFVSGKTESNIQLHIRAEAVKSMAEEGKNQVKIRFRQSTGYGHYVVTGDIELSQNTEWTPSVLNITDDMKTNGINLVVNYSDNGWNNTTLDGFFITIEFVAG